MTKSHIILAGTGRSGTTWIADIINASGRFRSIFEPLHPNQVPQLAHFGWRRYLRPDNDSLRFIDSFRDLLEGRIRNTWTDQQGGGGTSGLLLVKLIRGNLLLGWLRRYFPELRIVLLLRHPVPVALSRLKLGWRGNLDIYLNQPDLVEDYLQPHLSLLQSLGDEFQRHVASWCIDTLVPLRQGLGGDVHLCAYEEFCLHPRAALAKLFDFLDLPIGEVELAALKKPSSMTLTDSAADLAAGMQMAQRWRQQASVEQVDAAHRLMDAFGLLRLYDPDGNPQLRDIW